MSQIFSLRNEFHFSDVHGPMNHCGWRAKCKLCCRPTVVHSSMNIRKIKLFAYIYIHFSLSLIEKLTRRSHLQANREFTYSVTCVFKQRNGRNGVTTFATSNHIGDSHGFYYFKFDHVTLRDTMLFMQL